MSMERLLKNFSERSSRRGVLELLSNSLLVVLGYGVAKRMGSVPVVFASQCDNTILCGIYGRLCTDCGGSLSGCPSGTQKGSSWSACCADGKIYSYVDCCADGQNCSSAVTCHNGPPQPAWCQADLVYNCTIVLGGTESCSLN